MLQSRQQFIPVADERIGIVGRIVPGCRATLFSWNWGRFYLSARNSRRRGQLCQPNTRPLPVSIFFSKAGVLWGERGPDAPSDYGDLATSIHAILTVFLSGVLDHPESRWSPWTDHSRMLPRQFYQRSRHRLRFIKKAEARASGTWWFNRREPFELVSWNEFVKNCRLC